jgi:hypothetical protein
MNAFRITEAVKMTWELYHTSHKLSSEICPEYPHLSRTKLSPPKLNPPKMNFTR